MAANDESDGQHWGRCFQEIQGVVLMAVDPCRIVCWNSYFFHSITPTSPKTLNWKYMNFFFFSSFSKAESTACGICWDYSISSASGISASRGALYAKAVNRECVALKGCRTRQVQRGL